MKAIVKSPMGVVKIVSEQSNKIKSLSLRKDKKFEDVSDDRFDVLLDGLYDALEFTNGGKKFYKDNWSPKELGGALHLSKHLKVLKYQD